MDVLQLENVMCLSAEQDQKNNIKIKLKCLGSPLSDIAILM